MRECLICKESKEYKFLNLNTQGRKVFKDSKGNVWHGRVCYECHIEYNKAKWREKQSLNKKF